ncbi:MAG: HesA/MoeB/ThiF family protein [Bowdeniella nasicola]|nr:HesA/MoeB/ThiF family protein [Bowdeniella nasicola]
MPLTVPLARAVLPLREDQARRYLRTTLVPGIGADGQARLLASRVLVVGAGGLGSPVLLYLAAAGVGHITIADTDVVDDTNLQRQIVHDHASVGMSKTASAAARLRALNPDVEVREVGFLTEQSIDAEVANHDLILECSDTFATKFLVADACERAGKPLVWGTIVAMTFQVTVLWSAPPAGYPATRLRDLYPNEPPAGSTPSSAEVGVLGAACGQAGSAMAAEAVKLLASFGQPLLGRLLIVDVAAGRWNTVEYVAAARERAAERREAEAILTRDRPVIPDDDLPDPHDATPKEGSR